MERRTNKEYLEASYQCPFCGSGEIASLASIEVEGDMAFQDIHCNDCDKTWTDEYKLVGYYIPEDY